MAYFQSKPITDIRGAFSVEGYNVVVTGGNRGIGGGISRAFAQGGANVLILCRNIESGKAVAEEYNANYSGKSDAIQVDIGDEQSVAAAADKVYQIFDHIDVLVNNAGVATNKDFLSEGGLKEWHRVIDIDLHGVANVTYYFAPKMKENENGGSIINISSIGSQAVGNSKDHHNSPYNVAKAGVDIFTKYLAITLGDYGIRVNSILPGPTHSDLDSNLPPSAFAEIENDMPAHRFGEPIEIGALAVFLASQAGVQITGTNIPHDGGMLTVG
jgi:NAD(P)-dependent dehydrogenase (short-subunit alcohol dehydrogenase family)